ncbi:MAG: hypothetical protein LC128_01730 [Chitinophagales bacterium]|nr:hypothetical protein [Chitinophagales bacterium]
MKSTVTLVIFLLFAQSIFAQQAIKIRQDGEQIYTLSYDGFPNNISIDIRLPKTHKGSVQLIIPRSAPGDYGVVFYDHYLSNIKGYDDNDNLIPVTRGEGPRWIIGGTSSNVSHITYEMDLKKMEKEEPSGADASKIRQHYVGLLGYSVFGYVDGYEYTKINLHIKAPDGWPVFTTLRPTVPLIKNKMDLQIDNFDLLSDAQIMMGSALQVKRFDGGPVPLYVAQYAETYSSIDEMGKIGVSSMKLLHQYFGQTPFPYYTVYVEYLKPLDDQHSYNFGMEHLNSYTGFNDVSQAITTPLDSASFIKYQIPVLHHMGHGYIPLRCYGKGYRPFTWEMAPIINTIWFNEGFIWYITTQLLKINADSIFDKRVYEAPDFLKELSMRDLSALASTQYSADFRIGRHIYSRGALMAGELDRLINEKSNHKKSLRDALIYMLNWTKENTRAFTIEELPCLFQKATGVNVNAVFERWMKPVPELKIEN